MTHWAREERTVKVSGFSFVLHHKPSTVTFPWVTENTQHVKHTADGAHLRRTVLRRRRHFTLGLKKENKMRSRVQLISRNWVFGVTGSLIKTDTVLKNNRREMKAHVWEHTISDSYKSLTDGPLFSFPSAPALLWGSRLITLMHERLTYILFNLETRPPQSNTMNWCMMFMTI